MNATNSLINGNSPKTLMEAVRHFSSLDVCNEYLAGIKWPDGVVKCPKCDDTNIGSIASRRMYQCKNKDCRKQFSVKVGTIFEDSPLGLDKWFVAVWSITNAKNGISSCELARAIGVTQKSAWHMLHRVRHAMKTKSFNKMGGNGEIVEADETMVGALAINMHKAERKRKVGKNRGGTHMTNVMGLLERHEEGASQVRAAVIPNRQKDTLHDVIHGNVQPGSKLFTDALKNYRELKGVFDHQYVDHALAYVRGEVHTNGLENFWSLFKRCTKGTYVRPSPWHLFRYVDEQVLRFNQRKLTDSGRFAAVMPGVVGRRLTWNALTGH